MSRFLSVRQIFWSQHFPVAAWLPFRFSFDSHDADVDLVDLPFVLFLFASIESKGDARVHISLVLFV
jgi:hypothetical protein